MLSPPPFQIPDGGIPAGAPTARIDEPNRAVWKAKLALKRTNGAPNAAVVVKADVSDWFSLGHLGLLLSVVDDVWLTHCGSPAAATQAPFDSPDCRSAAVGCSRRFGGASRADAGSKHCPLIRETSCVSDFSHQRARTAAPRFFRSCRSRARWQCRSSSQ